jgi:hypothetical protein
MAEALIREARLRPEHAGSYPEIEPGVWTPAAGLARLVLDRGLYRHVPESRGDRPLPDAHFEFRGPSLPPEARPGGRSRQTDVSVAEAERDLEATRKRLGEELDAADSGLAEAHELEQRFEQMERRDEELREASRQPIDPFAPTKPRSVSSGREGGDGNI